MPWQKLCAPAPLPEAAGGWAKDSTTGTAAASALAKRKQERKDETADQKRERIKQESIIDALSDERVVDEDSFQKAVRARERRAMEDEEGLSGPLKDRQTSSIETSNRTSSVDAASESLPTPKRWAQDENGKEYPISTDRAEAIARWIREAPLSMGGGKKKKPARKKKVHGDCVNGVVNGVAGLSVGENGHGKDGDEDLD